MTKLRPPSPLYNPGGASDEDFLSGFVARKGLLELLINGLRAIVGGASSEHQLIVGQRGMGKSSLLRAVAARVAGDVALGETFAPLRFREEQYNVNALDVFWRNCGEALAQWCEDNGRDDLARRLDVAIETPDWRDADTAATAFLEACAEAGRRAILLVDNLDLVLDALKPGEPWALRRVLQMPGGPIVIGASVVFLKESANRDAAFYEFFHPHVLEPLDERELMVCLRALADRAGEAGDAVRVVLEREPGRVRALHGLTGGNPRVLVMTYQLLERRDTADLFADLEALLDGVSPYYKARVEDYATAQQRSVIDAIALNWDPILSHDLSAKAGIEITTVSGHLNRLKRDGFIEEVQTSGARAGYQIAERFLNIWYLMRHGTRRTRQRLAGLATFFGHLYSASELERLARLARDAEASAHWRPHYREGLLEAERRLARAARTPIAASLAEPSAHSALGGDLVGVSPRKLGEREPDAAHALLSAARAAAAKPDYPLAIRLCDELIERFGGAAAPRNDMVSAALNAKGVALWGLDRKAEALAAFDAVDARFGRDPDPAVRAQVAEALFNKGATLGALGRGEDALAVYDALDARFAGDADPAVRADVASALFNKGATLGALGRSEDALAVYDALDARFAGDADPAVRADVASALFNKGFTLGALGRGEDELAVYDAIDARFGGDADPAVRSQVARALVNKGFTLGALGRGEDALAVYNALDARFGGDADPAVRAVVAGALFNKGFTLGALGRGEDALAVYDALDARFAGDADPAIREIVARGVALRGDAAFDGRGDLDAAERAYRRASELDPGLLDARTGLMWLLILTGRVEEAAEASAALSGLSPARLGLLDVARELARDNFGAAMERLGPALGPGDAEWFDELLRLLRLAEARGYGERLIGWFASAGFDVDYAPIHAAFVAYVRGERFLRDVNPEVRKPARVFFDRLSAPRRRVGEPVQKPPRGRKRKA